MHTVQYSRLAVCSRLFRKPPKTHAKKKKPSVSAARLHVRFGFRDANSHCYTPTLTPNFHVLRLHRKRAAMRTAEQTASILNNHCISAARATALDRPRSTTPLRLRCTPSFPVRANPCRSDGPKWKLNAHSYLINLKIQHVNNWTFFSIY